MADLLVSKYEPQNFDEIVARQTLLKPIRTYIEANNAITNLLFEGFRGTGKTSTTMVIRNTLYGNEWRGRFFEINASKDNGVDKVRELANQYASLAIRPLSNGKLVHNIIFFDEADYLTPAAQGALRRIIEDFEPTCRFIFSCNFKEKLIDPILSRTKVYHFDPLPDKAVFAYLKWVAGEENIKIPNLDEQLKLVVKLSKGDMRSALNNLEDLQYGKTFSIITESLLPMPFSTFANKTFTTDITLIFGKLHEELIALASQRDIGEAMTILAEHEYYASMSAIKTLQAQACFMKLKKALNIK